MTYRNEDVTHQIFITENTSNKEDEETKIEVPMLPNQVIVHKNPSPENVIAGVFDERVTRKKKIDSKEMVKFACFISSIKTKNIYSI